MKAQAQVLRDRFGEQVVLQSVEQRLQRDVATAYLDRTSIEPRQIEQLVEQPVECSN